MTYTESVKLIEIINKQQDQINNLSSAVKNLNASIEVITKILAKLTPEGRRG